MLRAWLSIALGMLLAYPLWAGESPLEPTPAPKEKGEKASPWQGIEEAHERQTRERELRQLHTPARADEEASESGATKDGEHAEKAAANLSKAERAALRKALYELGSRDDTVRAQAKQALVKMGEATAVEMDLRFNIYSRRKRLEALDVLSQIDSPKARRLLAKRAVYDKHREVRKEAAKDVRLVGGKTARHYILARALDDSDKTRRQAARAIANVQDPAYIDDLIPATRTYLAIVAQGPVRIRGKLKSFDGATEREQRRIVPGSTIGNNVIPEEVRLPMKLPRISTTEFETTVVALALILRGGYDENMDTTKEWWKQNRGSFVWPELDPED